MEEKHAGGRPPKYKTAEEIPININNKNIMIEYTAKIKEEDFTSEKVLVDYIVNNIEYFAKDILQDEVISFEREKNIKEHFTFSPRGRRVDLYIKGKNKTYIIECKNPKYKSECRSAIGQILDYGREFSDSKKELIIITTFFDLDTAKTIEYYNLPIRYIYLSKKHILEYMGVE